MGQSYASPMPADGGERFVTVQLPVAPPAPPTPSPSSASRPARPRAGARPDVVLARLDAPLRPSALVVACRGGAAELRRVGVVSDEAVELLPEAADAAAPLRVARAEAPVLGTVLLRWAAMDG